MTADNVCSDRHLVCACPPMDSSNRRNSGVVVIRHVRNVVLAMLLAGIPAVAGAAGNDVTFNAALTRDEFHSLSRQLGFGLSYFPLATAAPLGLLGFDLGLEATAVNISDKSGYWQKAVRSGDPPSWLVVPKLHAQVGLPFNVDAGAIYSLIPDSNLSLVGGELKWAILEGGILLPAVAIRGSGTKVLGASEVNLETYGVDVSISKRILLVTPYAGVGQVWIHSSTDSRSLATQYNDRQNMTKAFVGLKLHLTFASIVAEADFSHIAAYSLRANFSF